ncbi:MAG: HAD-IA family hydrolase [Rubricoccaceae bacterium]|nr:HAD-IA family hydrolase [Rubricoccaceae bacterium]
MALDLDRVEALCFDVDGTLADTDNHLVQQIAELIAKLPFLSGREASRLARRVVMDAETPVNTVYGLSDRLGIDDELTQLRGHLDRLRPRRNPKAADQVPHDMMAGVQEMLAALDGRYPMSTISTGGEARVEAFLDHYEVLDLFTVVVTAQTTDRMKPYPDPLVHAAAAMGVAPERVLMIGDTTVDMQTAQAAGAQAVGVLCGFGTEDELRREGAALILETTSDLLPVLMPEEDSLDAESAVPEDQQRS